MITDAVFVLRFGILDRFYQERMLSIERKYPVYLMGWYEGHGIPKIVRYMVVFSRGNMIGQE